MPTLENNWFRRFILFTVYMIETIITVVTLSYFPLLFNSLGLDSRLYGIFGGLSLLPMIFKFFIGPISDKFPIPFLRGKRRGYFILGGLLNIIFLPLLSLNPLDFFALFFIIWFLQTLGIAIMDVMTDTLVITAKPSQNLRGRTGASIWVFFGIFVGGGLATGLVGLLNMNLLIGLSVFSLISVGPLALIYFLKEDPKLSQPTPSLWSDIKRNFGGPQQQFVIAGLIFAFLLNIDAGLLELTLEPFIATTFLVTWQELIATLFFISLLGTVLGFLGYFFIDKVQKNRLLIIISSIYIVPSIILAYLIFTGMLTYPIFLILYAIYGFVSGLSFVTYTGLFYDLSDPKAAGTMIALFLTMSNFGIVMGVTIGGFFPMWLIYVIVAIICGLRIIPLAFIKMSHIEKTFYQEEE
ncbi:MAG: MFS transporter [Candidatus Helarchaeota archaeon]|nr:MFS transporter [Candidatus Helarchaeota archaeon]